MTTMERSGRSCRTTKRNRKRRGGILNPLDILGIGAAIGGVGRTGYDVNRTVDQSKAHALAKEKIYENKLFDLVKKLEELKMCKSGTGFKLI